MLSPPTEYWVEKPGNPNFLISVNGPDVVVKQEGGGGGGDEEKKKSDPTEDENGPTSPKQGDESNPIPVPDKGKEEASDSPSEKVIYEFVPKKQKTVSVFEPKDEQTIGDLLYEAMQPLYQFIGMIEAESGKTLWYRFTEDKDMTRRMTPINWGATSYDEFRIRNSHLGVKILDRFDSNLNYAPYFVKPVKAEETGETARAAQGISFVGVLPDVQAWYQTTGQDLSDEEIRALPRWVWRQIRNPVFQFLLSSATFGALVLGSNELGFELKDLIVSPEVNFMFAQFVGRKFISPKSNAYPSGIQGGQMQYRISSGYNTSVQSNGKWLMGCREWFKQVFGGSDGFLHHDSAKPRRDPDTLFQITVRNARRVRELARPPQPAETTRIFVKIDRDDFGQAYGAFPVYLPAPTVDAAQLARAVLEEQRGFNKEYRWIYRGIFINEGREPVVEDELIRGV